MSIIDLAKTALAALEAAGYGNSYASCDLRNALADYKESDPVAVIEITKGREPELYATGNIDDLPEGVYKLFTEPVSAKREWVDLTDYEIVRLYAESPMCDSEMIAFARDVIAAFKEKNK